MDRLTAFLKTLHLSRVITAFAAGLLLLLTTACNNGTELGARPENSPVQMGGANNPHKMGGDGYSEYKASTDRSAVKGQKDRASLPMSQRLVAEVKSNASDLLYPNSKATNSKSPDIGSLGNKGKQPLMDAKEIPATRQPVIDRSDPDAKILEKSGQAFKDASGFLEDVGDTFTDRAGAVANPGISK